ncbi:MAG TPA: alpha/beta hydrolase [Thermoanaerobaculia bacterium]|nr:alpha/beta hydrolase [Thermoanaerobaculia bacterium]
MIRIGITIIVVLVLAFGVLALIANTLKRASLFFPERYPGGYWDTERLPVKPIEAWVTTSDGVKLHFWTFESPRQPAPLLIWFHGNGGNLSYRADTASELARRGISTVTFDYRGYGRSEGNPTEHGLYNDSVAAYDYAIDELGVAPRHIVLYGESLGGPYAAHVAAKRGGRGVIVENSFPSLVSMARLAYPNLPFSFFVNRSLRTTDYLNEAGVPVLVMHGKRDSIIPYRLGVELFEGLEVPRTFFTSETADHSEIAMIEGDRYYRAIEEFVAATADASGTSRSATQ